MSLKKLYITIFSIFIFYGVYSQKIEGGISVGLNLSQVDGDLCYGFHKKGLFLSGAAYTPLSKNFYFSLEISYSQKGSLQKAFIDNDTNNGYYKLKLDYADIPIMIVYDDKGKARFATGMSYGRLVNYQEWENKKKLNYKKNETPYNKEDIDWIGGFEFRITKNIWAGLRYSYSVSKIRTRIYERVKRDQYNNFLTIRMVYVFNPKAYNNKISTKVEE